MCINIIQICVASLFSFFSSNWLSTWRRRWLNQLWLKECIDRLSLPWSSLGIIVIEPPFFRNNFKGSQAHNISLNFCLFPVELMICFEQQLFTLIKLVSGFEAIAKRYAIPIPHSLDFNLNQYQFSLKNVNIRLICLNRIKTKNDNKYSANKITMTWIQISRQNWNASDQIMI